MCSISWVILSYALWLTWMGRGRFDFLSWFQCRMELHLLQKQTTLIYRILSHVHSVVIDILHIIQYTRDCCGNGFCRPPIKPAKRRLRDRSCCKTKCLWSTARLN